MTGQDRYDALANVRLAVGLARAYLGLTTHLSRPITPEEMDDMLAKAERDLNALTMEAGIGTDAPRPEGTQITVGEALYTLERETGDADAAL
jgi:hypothetical protein